MPWLSRPWISSSLKVFKVLRMNYLLNNPKKCSQKNINSNKQFGRTAVPWMAWEPWQTLQTCSQGPGTWEDPELTAGPGSLQQAELDWSPVFLPAWWERKLRKLFCKSKQGFSCLEQFCRESIILVVILVMTVNVHLYQAVPCIHSGQDACWWQQRELVEHHFEQ